MERNVLSRAAEFIKAQRRKKRWTKAVSAMAAVVVFCTTYALILPAITLQAECGKEEHTHSDACYTVETITPQPTMLCSLETLREAGLHEHDDNCYDDEGNLVCGFADFVVHEHDETCYDLDGNLICTLEEIEEHQHDADCYREKRVLVCDQEETDGHRHDDGCYDQVQGDLICTSEEEDHEHSDDCYEWSRELVCDQEETQGHTHSGDCYETERVLDCDKPEVELHEHDEDCYDDGVLTCGKVQVTEHVHGNACIQPPEGEPYEVRTLTCGKEEHEHVEACYLTEPPVEEPAEGETGEEPEEEIPEDSEQAAPPDVNHVVPDIGEARTASFAYENDGLILNLKVTGVLCLPGEESGEDSQEMTEEPVESASGAVETTEEEPDQGTEPIQDAEPLPEEPAQTDPWDQVELSVTELDRTTETFNRILAFAQEHGGNDELYDIRAVEVHFLYEGVELDTSGWEITAEVTLTDQMMTPPAVNPYAASEEADVLQPMAVMSARTMSEEDSSEADAKTDAEPSAPIQVESGEAAPEAEAGVVVSLFQETEEEVTQLDSVLLQEGEETPALRVTMQSNVLAVSTATTANPKFTVQYYAYLDIADTTGSNPLKIIDTSERELPQNGTVPKIKDLFLSDTGNGKYQVATTKQLCEVYAARNCEYIKNPNLAYFNSLYENGNYELKAIWILKESGNETSTDQTDWKVYGPGIHFTNREASVNDTTVLITDETVIRLVFDTTSAGYTNAVNFYDYDITDDGTHTAQQGINTDSNYTQGDTNGTKLAFGNDNTGMGLSRLQWNGNQLNMYNSKAKGSAVDGYKGCTFGLTTGLSEGKIQYASGVTAPKLFNEGNTHGKTSYDNRQYSLQFERVGDTYTLSAVNGAGLTGLQYFNHPSYGETTYESIWTNNFWPMDSVKNMDPHTGAFDGENRVRYTLSDGKTQLYPKSDDGLAHNNMFGMQYAVQFTLTEDYTGPLEYYFFGDDDMWVFLDNRLVCDIGGVHSSVGEYVNLWDYVAKGSSGTHTLTFFYTERGLSGSTCYMQFTLPSVSSITPEQNTGVLRVEKTVDGPDTGDQEFRFEIKFTDQGGNTLPDDYSYTRYKDDGSIVKQDVIIFNGGSFELKAGEYVEINYLPIGTQYTITERAEDGYSTTVSVNDLITAGGTATGTIQLGKCNRVKYVNKTSYVLPSTGGPGTHWYTLGGLCLMAGALWLYKNPRGKRGRDSLQ